MVDIACNGPKFTLLIEVSIISWASTQYTAGIEYERSPT